MKEQAIGCKKMHRLARRLGVPRAYAVGLMEMFWAGVRQDAPDGSLRDIDPIDVAVWCDWEGDPEALLLALVAEKWIDADPEHRYIVHDWPDHCENSVHRQLIKERRWFANGSQPSVSRANLNSTERQKAEEFYARNEPKMAPIVPSEIDPDLSSTGITNEPEQGPPKSAMAKGQSAKIRHGENVATPRQNGDSPPKKTTPYRTVPHHTVPHHTADTAVKVDDGKSPPGDPPPPARRRDEFQKSDSDGMVSAQEGLQRLSDVEWLRELLWGHSRLPEPPDRDICVALLADAPGKTRDWWLDLVARLERGRQKPKQTYGWYVGIVQREMRMEAEAPVGA